MHMLFKLLLSAALLSQNQTALAFCGFYVAKADTSLYNNSSKVVFVRDGNRSVITMASDYEGEARDFALIVPVPTVLKERQINVAEHRLIDHLDAYTAPRLVEYHDANPCHIRQERVMFSEDKNISPMPKTAARNRALGVTIEAEYTVGEYDILILSAEESDGLLTWLAENGYKVPSKASEVVGSYLKQDMKFFIAKVNMSEKLKLGVHQLRPIQIAFESSKFMLPIRLGTVNAKHSQEMFVFALTRNGRVEATNYRTRKLPSNVDIPVYVKKDFGKFYHAMFETQVKKENNRAIFLEYAWNMAWCDPCAADPLSPDDLRALGVMWLPTPGSAESGTRPSGRGSQAVNAYVTRLHLRYDQNNFPEDLKLQVTGNSENFQGRYVLRHPWRGKAVCREATEYQKTLGPRFYREATTLANLTGWDITNIREAMAKNGQTVEPITPPETRPEPTETPPSGETESESWWEKLWR